MIFDARISLAILLTLLSLILECGTTINSQILRHHTIYGKNGVMKLSYISMRMIEDKILQVIPITGFYARNSRECQQKCLLTNGCISFNLIPENATYFHCYLLNKDHYKRPQLLLDAIGAQYHVVSVSY